MSWVQARPSGSGSNSSLAQPDCFFFEFLRESSSLSFYHGRLLAHFRALVGVHKTRAGQSAFRYLLLVRSLRMTTNP